MKHLVVLEVVQKHRRRAGGVRGHEDRRPRNPVRRRRAMSSRKSSIGSAFALDERRQPRPPLLPGGHEGVDHDRHGEREPAAVRDLEQVGAEEGEVDDQEAATAPRRPCHRSTPSACAPPRRRGCS